MNTMLLKNSIGKINREVLKETLGINFNTIPFPPKQFHTYTLSCLVFEGYMELEDKKHSPYKSYTSSTQNDTASRIAGAQSSLHSYLLHTFDVHFLLGRIA